MKFNTFPLCTQILTIAVCLVSVQRTTATSATTDASTTNTTCGAALLACMPTNTGSSDSCSIMASRVECFASTRDSNCTIDESVLSFDSLGTTLRGVCDAVVNYTTSCWDFLQCSFSTDYEHMMAAINRTVGPTVAQGNNLTSTRFWCTYLHQTVDCFISHSTACDFSTNAKAIVNAQLYWLTHACDGIGTTPNQQCRNGVTGCLNADTDGDKDCVDQTMEMQCLGNKQDLCELNQTVATFDALGDIVQDVCEVIRPFTSSCAGLRECLAGTYYAQIPGLTSSGGPAPAVYSGLLNTVTWCRYLRQTANCFVTTRQVCGVSQTIADDFDHIEELISNSCAGDGATAGGWNYNVAPVLTCTLLHVLVLVVIALHFN